MINNFNVGLKLMQIASCTKCPKIIVILWFGFDAAYSFVKTEKQGFKCFALNVFQLHEDS